MGERKFSLLLYKGVANIKKESLDGFTSFTQNIKDWVNKCLLKIPYDKTVRANVVEVLGDNQYKVFMLGREFTVNSAESYNLHDTMRVLIEQNDIKKLYVLPKN